MLVRSRIVLLSLVWALMALPAAAATRVEALPAIKESMAARFEQVLVLNDQAFMVGKGEIESPTRAYFVFRMLPMNGMPEMTLEMVAYDGALYVRDPENGAWYVGSMDTTPVAAPGTDPVLETGVALDDAPISSIGTTPIAGEATDQYQIWINDEDPQTTDHLKLDFFIGQRINYLHQLQVSLVATDPELGPVKLEAVTRLYDFDNPAIIVGRPTGAIEIATATRSFTAPLQPGGALSTLAAPFATSQLRDLAALRLGR
jgi:hypothetical protein